MKSDSPQARARSGGDPAAERSGEGELPVAREARGAVAFDPTTQILLDARSEDRSTFRRAVLTAIAVHILLLLVTFPNLARPKDMGGAAKPSKVFVVQQVRFKPPVKQKQQEIPKRKAKKIPIPDPTPNDPEPLLIEEIDLPEVDLPEIEDAIFGIPDAPPSTTSGQSQGPIYIGEGISRPEKIYSFQPHYTEEARQSRIQGTVILQAVIDAEGNVTDVQVLKGLPLGLSESAIETVKQWKYKPATQDGKPVAVYLNLLVNFTLQ